MTLTRHPLTRAREVVWRGVRSAALAMSSAQRSKSLEIEVWHFCGSSCVCPDVPRPGRETGPPGVVVAGIRERILNTNLKTSDMTRKSLFAHRPKRFVMEGRPNFGGREPAGEAGG